MKGKALKSSMNEFLAIYQPLKMIPQLLLSLSIFSFMFSYSSLLHSTKFHCFSANTFQLMSLALNKNCLFLICNGLLVFLAKTSGLVRPPSGYDLNDALLNRSGDGLQISAFEAKELHLEESNVSEEREAEEDMISDGPNEVFIAIAESEEEGGACDVEKDGGKTDARKCWLFDDDGEEQLYGQQTEEQKEEEEDDDDGTEKEDLNAEELKQKFEDFIRKMRKEIIINEARRKVVEVN